MKIIIRTTILNELICGQNQNHDNPGESNIAKEQKTNRTLLNIFLKSFVFIFFVMVSGGCVLSEKHSKIDPGFTFPDRWAVPEGTIKKDSFVGWVHHFNDNRLEKLIHRALNYNFNIRIAATNLEKAKATLMMTGAERLPILSAGFHGIRDKTVEVSDNKVLNIRSRRYGLTLGMKWEIDLWGKLKDRRDAAKADMDAVEFDFEAARLSLAGEVAKNWFDSITARLQLQLAEETVKSYEESSCKIRNQFERGISSALDLRLALSNLADSRNLLGQREIEYAHSIQNLQLLIGTYPDADFAVTEVLPIIEMEIPCGLPSQLLERRNDIIAAKQRIVAADKRFSHAEKSFLPSLSLTGNFGTGSRQLKKIVDANYSVWNILGNLVQPVFQGGSLRADLLDAGADVKRVYLEYGLAVLTAFREVEGALSAEGHLKQRETSLKEAVRQSEGAEKLAWDLYLAGAGDMITVLEARRRVLESKVNFLSVRNARLQNRIDVYLALGGNFEKST